MLSEYYMKAQADLDAARDEAKRWRHEMQQADSPLMRQYYDEVQELESKCDAASIALKACIVGGKNLTEEQESGLDKALSEVRQTLDNLRRKLK